MYLFVNRRNFVIFITWRILGEFSMDAIIIKHGVLIWFVFCKAPHINYFVRSNATINNNYHIIEHYIILLPLENK